MQSDPQGRMRLPKGFSYKVFSQTGETMNDGFIVPGAHDGMDAFPGPNGLTLLVRNHEMSPLDFRDNPFSKSSAWKNLDASKLYDAGKSGTQLRRHLHSHSIRKHKSSNGITFLSQALSAIVLADQRLGDLG